MRQGCGGGGAPRRGGGAGGAAVAGPEGPYSRPPAGGREPCGAMILRQAGACGGEGALLGYCSTFYEKKKRLSPAK